MTNIANHDFDAHDNTPSPQRRWAEQNIEQRQIDHTDRLARIETKVENLQKETKDIKEDIKDIKTDIKDMRSVIEQAIGSVGTIKWIIKTIGITFVISAIIWVFKEIGLLDVLKQWVSTW